MPATGTRIIIFISLKDDSEVFYYGGSQPIQFQHFIHAYAKSVNLEHSDLNKSFLFS